MKAKNSISPRYRLHRYLALGYVLFIVYVSLTPFSGWQEQNFDFIDVLTAPLLQTFTLFDFALNFLSYIPLGFLLAYMIRGGHRPPVTAATLATLVGLALAVLMEYTQMYLPSRVSSNSDLLSDTMGTLCGSMLAMGISQHIWFSRIRTWHNEWFKHGRMSDFGLALLALWIFAQINPSQPMLGSVFVGEVARWKFDIVPASPFNWQESAEVMLNLLLLGILLSMLLRERRHSMNALLLMLFGVTLMKFIAAAVLLKSWALLIWMNSEAVLGILLAISLLTAAWRLALRWMIFYGALAACIYLTLVLNLMLASTSSAAHRLYHWHYNHMLNYNSLSQLAILLFPILLLGYMWRTSILRKPA